MNEEEQLDTAINDSIIYLHSVIKNHGASDDRKIKAAKVIADFARIFLAEMQEEKGSDIGNVFRGR